MSYQGLSPKANRLRLQPRSADPVNPTEGDIFYADGSSRNEGLWQYTDGAWKQVGTAGSGINYAAAFFAGDSITGINTYNDGASPTPVDGTGGVSAGLTTTINTVNPLRGSRNQRFSKDAADRQGMGWSWDFSIDRADYEGSKPVVISFTYKTSANYAGGLRLFVYDRDANQLIAVSSLAAADGSLPYAENAQKYVGIFYTNSTSNDYRLIWHQTSTNANAWDLDWIDLSVGPDMEVPGAIITEPVAYTPTITNFGTVTNVDFKSWREGKYLCGLGKFTAGTPAAALGSFTIGHAGGSANVNIDTAQLGSTNQIAGSWTTNNTNNSAGYVVTFNDATQLGFGNNFGSAGAPQGSRINASALGGASNQVIVSYKVPIAGWTASIALSQTDLPLQTVQVVATKTTGAITVGTTVASWDTKNVDNQNAFNATTGTFTAPRAGNYAVTFSGTYNALAVREHRIYKNGVLYTPANAGASSLFGPAASTVVPCVAGDTITVQLGNAGGTPDATSGLKITIAEQPDFRIYSTFPDTTDVELFVDSPNGFGSTNTVIRRYSNIRKNTLGSYATFTQSATLGDSVTINRPGKYSVVVSDSRTDGSSVIGISVNATLLTTSIQTLTYADGRRAVAAADAGNFPNAVHIGRFNAGDVIRAHAGNSPNTTNDDAMFKLVYLGP